MIPRVGWVTDNLHRSTFKTFRIYIWEWREIRSYNPTYSGPHTIQKPPVRPQTWLWWRAPKRSQSQHGRIWGVPGGRDRSLADVAEITTDAVPSRRSARRAPTRSSRWRRGYRKIWTSLLVPPRNRLLSMVRFAFFLRESTTISLVLDTFNSRLFSLHHVTSSST